MYLIKKIVVLLLAIILITGCSSKDNPMSVEKRLDELFTGPYKAMCSAVVKSNKAENMYQYTCVKNADGVQRLDFGDVCITVSADGAVIERNGEIINTSFAEGEMVFAPDYFFKNYQKEGTIKQTAEGYELECCLAGSTQYRRKLIMKTDKNLVPVGMLSIDENGETGLDIKIEKFLKQ